MLIKAKKRDAAIKPFELRQKGEIPAVFYGAGVKTSTPISVGAVEFKKVWAKAGESSAVKVATPDGEVDVLIHEVQTDPETDQPIHVDFLAIDMNKKIKVKVPLEFVGISGAVKGGLGNLVKVLHEVEVEALPKNLPHSLEVDLSKLATVEDTIFISDIKIPTGVEIIESLEDVVASIILQKEEKEEEAVPVDLSAIELADKKGKKEEEGAPGADAEAPAKEEKA